MLPTICYVAQHESLGLPSNASRLGRPNCFPGTLMRCPFSFPGSPFSSHVVLLSCEPISRRLAKLYMEPWSHTGHPSCSWQLSSFIPIVMTTITSVPCCGSLEWPRHGLRGDAPLRFVYPHTAQATLKAFQHCRNHRCSSDAEQS